MPLFTPYFPLESNAYRVGKSGQLRRQMGTAGFGLYVMVLSHLRDCPNCTAELDYDALGYELHEDPALVRRVVEDFDLFLLDREHGTFTAEALREVAATARPRSRSKRNSEERRRRERKSSRRTTDTADAEALDEPAEEADTAPTDEETAATDDDTADLFADDVAEEGDTADALPTEAPLAAPATADAEAANDNAPAKNDRPVAERKEENKKPSPPIVPLPQGASGKGETPQNARREEEAPSRRSAVAVSLPSPSARGDESKLPEVGEKAETSAERPTPSDETPSTAQPTTATTAGDLPQMCDPATTASETAPQGVENSLDVKDDDERTERNRRPPHWTRERFVAPNAREVAAYAHLLGRPRFDALRFVLYYESRGWLLQGGLAVADWRSLVKLWLVRGDAQHRGTPSEPQTAYATQTGGFSNRHAPKTPISSTVGGNTSPSLPGGAGLRQPSRTTSVQQRREDDLARWASALLGVTPDTLSAGSASFAAPSSPDLAANFETSAGTSPQFLLGADESEHSFTYADEDTAEHPAFVDEATAPDDALSAHATEPEDAPTQEGAEGEAGICPADETSNQQSTENKTLGTETPPEPGEVSTHENTLLFTFNTPPYVSRKWLEPFSVALGGKRSPLPDGRGNVHPLPLADESSPTDDAAERRRSAAERRECTACLSAYRDGCVPF